MEPMPLPPCGRWTRTARVLLASGHSEEDVAGRFSDMGIAGILQKPYTLSKLREAITAILGPGGHPHS